MQFHILRRKRYNYKEIETHGKCFLQMKHIQSTLH